MSVKCSSPVFQSSEWIHAICYLGHFQVWLVILHHWNSLYIYTIFTAADETQSDEQ